MIDTFSIKLHFQADRVSANGEWNPHPPHPPPPAPPDHPDISDTGSNLVNWLRHNSKLT